MKFFNIFLLIFSWFGTVIAYIFVYDVYNIDDKTIGGSHARQYNYIWES